MFVEYKDKRDSVIFLGAGASYCDGVPLQKDIVPEILNPTLDGLIDTKLQLFVSKFIKAQFSISEKDNAYPQLETIFSYIDYFIDNNISLNVEYSLNTLQSLKESLIKVIYFITSKSIHTPLTRHGRETEGRDKDSIYSKFWEEAKKTNRNFSVITTNYDNQIDDAFDMWLYPKYGLIDYCIDFLNYTKEKFIGYDWWVNPREPIPDWEDCNPIPIKLIKIHGSLNWKFCHCCSQTVLTPWTKHIDLNTGELHKFDPAWGFEIKNVTTCPRDGHPLSTLIVPPTHNKTLKHPVIQNLLYEAQKEIRLTKKVVFVGYSFPEADIHIKAIFDKNLQEDVEILVVNPFLSKESKYSYKSLSSKVEFIETGFNEALEDGLLERVTDQN